MSQGNRPRLLLPALARARQWRSDPLTAAELAEYRKKGWPVVTLPDGTVVVIQKLGEDPDEDE